jgi:hypothetical protein
MNYVMNSSKIFLYESMKYNMDAQILSHANVSSQQSDIFLQ